MVCVASWTIYSHCADLNTSLRVLVSLCRVWFKTDYPYSKLPYYDPVHLLLGIIIVVHGKKYYVRYKQVINFQLASAVGFYSLGKEIILRVLIFFLLPLVMFVCSQCPF